MVLSTLAQVTRAIVQDTFDNSLRYIFGSILAAIIFLIVSQKSYNMNKHQPLTKKEEDELIEEFQPEPLVPKTQKKANLNVVEGAPTVYMKINDEKVLNFATFNSLGFTNKKEIKEECIKAIDKYGVGSCGPRGFYGTMDVHFLFEKSFYDWLGYEDGLLYSYGFCTVSSLIPCFSKRQDFIVVDEKCNYAIQVGVNLSRSKYKTFKHNDLNDLERILKEYVSDPKNNTKAKSIERRYIIVEGIYANTGNIVNLKRIVELKYKYKFRIILDDSVGIGVLGETGKGTIEHFHCQPKDIDFVNCSLEYNFGTTGGIVCCSNYTARYQRLQSVGFVFSASNPPYTVQAARSGLEILKKNAKEIKKQIQENITHAHELLNKIESVKVISDKKSPILFVEIDKLNDVEDYEELAQKCLENKLAIAYPNRNTIDWNNGMKAIRINISADHTVKDVNEMAKIFEASILGIQKASP